MTLRAWMAVAIFAALMLAMLGGQLVFIVQQRGIVDHQRDIATRQEARAAPLLETGNALLGSRADARRALGEVGATIDGLRAMLPELREQLPRIPEIVTAVERTVAVLERSYPTLRESLSVQHRTLGVGERSLGVQERSLEMLEQSLAVQRTTLTRSDEILAVARETLTHTRSIDNKTGGPGPATPLTP